MASEGGSGSNTVVIVIIVAVVLWLLLNKASSTVRTVNQSNKQTYTAGTAASSVITNLAPALGTFVSGLLSGSSGSEYTVSQGQRGHTLGGDGGDLPAYLSDDSEAFDEAA